MDAKQLRLLWDFLVATGLLSMAFFAGTEHAKIIELDARIKEMQDQRGKVKISMEATERLSCLESVVKECKR